MTQLQMVAAATLTFLALLATECPGRAAQGLGSGNPTDATCTAQFRRCVSRCGRVYESHRATRACRSRCDDDISLCESRAD
jgi:hypothetical protein